LALIFKLDTKFVRVINPFGHRHCKLPVAVIFAGEPRRSLNRNRKHVKHYAGMFSVADKERKRSYLLPGVSGRAYRRKRNVILTCSALIGFGVSVILAALLYWMNRLSP